MVKDKEGERGARFFLAVFTNFSGTILLLKKKTSTCLLLISRFSDFAFSDRGSQTPLPFVREAEVLPASNCHDYKSYHN